MLNRFAQNCSYVRVGVVGLPRSSGVIRIGSTHGSGAMNGFAIEHPLLAMRGDSVCDDSRNRDLLQPPALLACLVLRKRYHPHPEPSIEPRKLLNSGRGTI